MFKLIYDPEEYIIVKRRTSGWPFAIDKAQHQFLHEHLNENGWTDAGDELTVTVYQFVPKKGSANEFYLDTARSFTMPLNFFRPTFVQI